MTTNPEEPTITSPAPNPPPTSAQGPALSSPIVGTVLPQGRGLASIEELRDFSLQFDNLWLDVSKPSYTIRTTALIAERRNRELIEGISSNLILLFGLLL